MEDENFEAWEESTLAQYEGDVYVPTTPRPDTYEDYILQDSSGIDSDEVNGLSDSSDEWAKRYFAKETIFRPTYDRP